MARFLSSKVQICNCFFFFNMNRCDDCAYFSVENLKNEPETLEPIGKTMLRCSHQKCEMPEVVEILETDNNTNKTDYHLYVHI